MFALKVIDGLSTGIEIALKQDGVVVVGRDVDVDGVIEDPLCSGRHFEVAWSAATGITVRDLGSLNGVFVNGERIREPRKVKRGDFVQAGTTLLEIGLAVQTPAQEQRASERAPTVKAAATMMMSAADLQEAIATTRAQARTKQKDLGRSVVKTQRLERDELAKMISEEASGLRQKTMVLPALSGEFFSETSQPSVKILTQLLEATPAESTAIFLVRKGASVTPHAKSVVTIGRDARNDVPLVSEDVSGSHARIVIEPSGRFEIVDEGSTNGSFVNGKRVVRHYLNTGDVLQLGQWTGTVVIVGKRLGLDLQREGVKIQDAGVIKVIKADAVGAREWDPLHREKVRGIKIDYKRDRAELLAKKKKGKSSQDIAFTATSDTERQIMKGRLAWAGLVVSPVVVLAVLMATSFDALAPGAVSAPHATAEFLVQAREKHDERDGLWMLAPAATCTACHQGDVVVDARCAQCHAELPTNRHQRVGLTCFDCHSEHNGREFSPTAAARVGCVGCHEGDPHEFLLAAGAEKRAKARAPVIAAEKLSIDAFDVHRLHMSIEGRCLGCHDEGLQPVAADARRSCGTCHAQARPEADSCVTCHQQHPENEKALASLSTPVTPEERWAAARVDPGNLGVFLALALGILCPVTLLGFAVRPRSKADDVEIVEETRAATTTGVG
jgi:pSer/pThr/pTyr-binding forkhead associated (FHA) protein